MDSIVADVETVARQCAENNSLDFQRIIDCTQSPIGNQLQHTCATITKQNKPDDAFVPWVTVNNQHSDDIQDRAQTDLIALLCDTYQVIEEPNLSMLAITIDAFASVIGFTSTSSVSKVDLVRARITNIRSISTMVRDNDLNKK
jgi:hypothetical protein